MSDDEGDADAAAGGEAGNSGVPARRGESDANRKVIRAIFTWFPREIMNPLAVDEIKDWQQTIMEFCSYFVMQTEMCPTTNRVHYQGYLELKYRMRYSTIKHNVFRDKKCPVNFRQRRGEQDEAIVYCQKERSRIPGVAFAIGTPCEMQKAQNADHPKSLVAECIEIRHKARMSLKRGRNPMNDVYAGDNVEMAMRFPGGTKQLIIAETIKFRHFFC